MAKQQLRTYVFAPGAAGVGTIKLPGRYDLSQLLVITNTTNNAVLYNFADPTYAGTAVSFTAANDATSFPTITQRVDGYTTITLDVSTVGQLATDKLQIFIEDRDQTIRPWPFGTDAIERMRVSNPQSLIDADFEYGLQPTKWAGYGTQRGYPSIYEFPGVDLTVGNIVTNGAASNSTISVFLTTPHGMTTGQAANITSLNPAVSGFSRADGNFVITASGTNWVTYFANGVVGTAGQSLLTDLTLFKRGDLYTGATLNTATTHFSNGASPSVITLNFNSNHGLVPGTPLYVNMASGTNAALATGPFFAETVQSLTSCTYTARTGGAVTTPAVPTVYSIPPTSIVHRPFDGGVILSCKTPAYGAQAVRVSKRYFRYQSGKGLLWSTGTLFKPNYDIQTLSASGTAIGSTITCKVDDIDHGLQIGATIEIVGVSTSGYNGTYTVASIVDDYTVTFLATTLLGSTTPSFNTTSKLIVSSWHGGVVRAGVFDDQNGMFWEYSGSILSVVRRSSVLQLTGTIAINVGSNTVTGTNTRFTSQIKVGDKIVIRGMTHWVTQVVSNTSMSVTPDFRGTTNVTGVKASIVVETRIKQSDFNIDKLDGTGPSGYTIDLTKMQMMGLQYTWYGAGFIDYMVRGSDGNWVFAHRIKNNNVNYEAHMRSGNLPVRYSIENEGAPGGAYLTADPGTGGTTLNVNDTTYFPTAGTLYIDNELISYTGKTATSFTGCTRAATLTQWSGGSSRGFTAGAASAHAANTGILLVSNQCTPTLSHWGSALICDGGFDKDRGYIFNYQRANMPINATTQTAFLIRLAPSVSNSQVGDLGAKDLLNRSQLLLNSVGITTTLANAGAGAVIVEGILNPKNFSNATWNALNFESVGGQPSLCQVSQTPTWTAGTYAIPGEQVFAFAAAPNTSERLALEDLKELTNSPIGGVGVYPNGSDILAINVRTAALATTATVLLRWGEAQA